MSIEDQVSTEIPEPPGMRHKPNCVFELDPQPGCFHRTPIDCVTPKQLWDTIDELKKEVQEKEAEIKELATQLWRMERAWARREGDY